MWTMKIVWVTYAARKNQILWTFEILVNPWLSFYVLLRYTRGILSGMSSLCGCMQYTEGVEMDFHLLFRTIFLINLSLSVCLSVCPPARPSCFLLFNLQAEILRIFQWSLICSRVRTKGLAPLKTIRFGSDHCFDQSPYNALFSKVDI